MVITKLMGGLGNQMFQYALGRKVSLHLRSPLKLDHSFLERDPKGEYTQRFYELDPFNCIQTRPTREDLDRVQKSREKSLFSFLHKNKFSILIEKGFPYNEAVENLSGDCYLDGFWQSEKYFQDIKEVLLKDFTLASAPRMSVQEIKNRILSDSNSVSIHFRRGDYVHLSPAANFHGTATMDYYRKAVSMMNSKINDPAYFIFSDDIEWVKNNFNLPGAEYLSGLKGYEDLELMKSCRHHIIANSSFSWWGAWLDPHADKIVIAPKLWFKDGSIDTKDLIPQEWLKV